MESATKVVTHENSVSNIPMETNNNIEEELLKNDESKYNDKVTKRITVTKTDKKKNKIHSIANVPIKRMRTRNMSKNLSNHIYQNTTNKKRKKFTEKSTLINDENFFRGWKI